MPAVEGRPILEGAAGTRVLLRGLRRRGCCKNRAGTGDWPYGLDHVTACMPPGEMACHTLVTRDAGHNWRTTIAAENDGDLPRLQPGPYRRLLRWRVQGMR